MEKCKLVIAVLGVLAVPTLAFAIRMYEGDTRTDNERTISEAFKKFVNSPTIKEAL